MARGELYPRAARGLRPLTTAAMVRWATPPILKMASMRGSLT